MKIYAAGKVAQGNWRERIFGIRGVWDLDDMEKMTPWPEIKGDDSNPFTGEDWTYVGPYALSCDHGCMHGANQHGLNADGTGEGGAYPGVHRDEIHRRCLEAIDACTHVFAWIDDPTAYGTLVEIGYALARGKSVHVYFDSAKRSSLLDLWFAAYSGKFAWAANADSAWSAFLRQPRDEWS